MYSVYIVYIHLLNITNICHGDWDGERGLQELLLIGQVVIVLACQLALVMLHAVLRRRTNAVVYNACSKGYKVMTIMHTIHMGETVQETILKGHVSQPAIGCNISVCPSHFWTAGPSPQWPLVPMQKCIAVSARQPFTSVYAARKAIHFKMLSQFVKLPNMAEAQTITHHNSVKKNYLLDVNQDIKLW